VPAWLACQPRLRLSKAQFRVVMYEQTGHAGGRCRSFHDPTLDAIIDNGNHLLLSGNKSALSYLETVNAAGRVDRAGHRFVSVRGCCHAASAGPSS
jgi:phytoene dehydrogenase-like protein